METLETKTTTEWRLPDGRWSETAPGRTTDQDDPILREAREFRAAIDDLTTATRTIIRRHPDLSIVYCLYRDMYRYSIRWLIELYVTAGWTNAQISAELQGVITERQLELYRHLFYDIEAHRDDPKYMEKCVLKRAQQRMKSQPELDETDFFYKQQAHNLRFLMLSTGLPGHAPLAIHDWLQHPVEYWLTGHRYGYG